jgi:hypothetical protein
MVEFGGMKQVSEYLEIPEVGDAYFTRDVLLRCTSHSTESAARQSMAVMGYVIVAKEGSIVRQLSDGSHEELERIAQRRGPCMLD